MALGVSTSATVPGMTFKHYLQSQYAGSAGYTQLISGEFDSDLTVATHGYELDVVEWARGLNTIRNIGSWSQNVVPFDDQPDVGLANFKSATGMNLSFRTSLRFKPDGVSNIFVTLRIVTWGVSASATKAGGVWSVDASSAPSGPQQTDNDACPVCTETF